MPKSTNTKVNGNFSGPELQKMKIAMSMGISTNFVCNFSAALQIKLTVVKNTICISHQASFIKKTLEIKYNL